MSRRLAAIALLFVAIACAGCSTPKTAPGTLADGKQHVTKLVLAALHALPPTVHYHPPTVVGTQVCRRTIAGYAVGTTGAHRAEVPLIVTTPADRTAETFLPLIERAWAAAGYRLDRSRLHESRFPQLRAHAPAGYDIVATAFAGAHQLDLYAVSQCLRGP